MLRLDPDVWERMKQHAETTYPEECCGVIVSRSGRLEVVRVTNVQNELHARDPETFPRTARTAYSMRYEEVAPLLDDAYRGKLELIAFYHSHPDHDAYFSAEDRAAAAGWLDDPNYARALQIVLSVRSGAVADLKAYRWDAGRQDFVPAPVAIERD